MPYSNQLSATRSLVYEIRDPDKEEVIVYLMSEGMRQNSMQLRKCFLCWLVVG